MHKPLVRLTMKKKKIYKLLVSEMKEWQLLLIPFVLKGQ